MEAMKDKRKFGGASPISKNRNCKKFGYSYDKEVRRIWRIEARQLAHKILMHLPVSREEIQAATHILIALCSLYMGRRRLLR